MTGHTAALVPTLEGVYFESRGRQELRNVREPVEVFAAIPTPHERKKETLVRRQ